MSERLKIIFTALKSKYYRKIEISDKTVGNAGPESDPTLLDIQDSLFPFKEPKVGDYKALQEKGSDNVE